MTIRGRLDVKRQQGKLAGRLDRAACIFDEFGPDLPANQLIKRALTLVTRYCDPHLSRKSASLLASFSEVSDLTGTSKRSKEPSRDRRMGRYAAASAWADMIVQALSPSLHAGSNQAPGILFDMNKVFERVASRRLASILHQRADLSLTLQDTSTYLARYAERPALSIKPDIVIRNGETTIAVADVKWKRLELDSSGAPKVQEDDAYQMLAYAAAFGCTEVTLIYPSHQGISRRNFCPFVIPLHAGHDARLSIMLVDLADRHYEVATSATWFNSLASVGA